MLEKKRNYVYRLCPCNPTDVEAMQSWLEDMAAEGLFLIKEGIFCGSLFTFERRLPRKVTYRFDVAQKRKLRFFDSGDQVTSEELKLYESMGWEYLLQYEGFRIYRSFCCDAPELNTESEIHAYTINLLKRKQRSSFVGAIVTVLLWLFVLNSAFGRVFMVTALFGPLAAFCGYTLLLSAVFKPLVRVFWLHRYEKRLMAGDALNRRVDWRKKRLGQYGKRLAALLMAVGLAVGFSAAYMQSNCSVPIDEYPGEPPFATVADVFPDAKNIRAGESLGYYGQYETVDTSAASYIKWKENAYVTTADGEKYFCILIIEYFDTDSEWFAKGVETDCYLFDAMQPFRRKPVEYDAPDLDVDSVRVYNHSSGITVLMREDNRVVSATVLLDDGANQNQWQLWAQAMAEKMK